MRALATLIVLFLLVPSVMEGKVKTNLELRFMPKQTVAEARATIDPAMLDRPVAVRVEDARPKEPDWVGTRMDDDDRVYDLRATTPLVVWAEKAVIESLRRSNLRVEATSDLVFVAKLLQLQVDEADQALGSVYKARVDLMASLVTSDGATLWSGTASGDASRYGRSQNDNNCNEVLSDSLLEAVVAALSQQGLHDAWTRRGRADAAPAPKMSVSTARRLSAAELLKEVRSLVDGGFDRVTLLQFVNQQTLSSPFAAEDLKAWKAAGISPEIIQAALKRPAH